MFTDTKSLSSISGEVNCEGPNNAIYKFEGNISISGKHISLDIDSLLLRGSSLRNTDYAFCQCIYQGHDTKIMRNSAAAKYKFSNVDIITNRLIGLVLLTQIVLSSIAAVLGVSWNLGNGLDATYLTQKNSESAQTGEQDGFGILFVQQTGTWILIFTNFVPISLMVTLELIKFW